MWYVVDLPLKVVELLKPNLLSTRAALISSTLLVSIPSYGLIPSVHIS